MLVVYDGNNEWKMQMIIGEGKLHIKKAFWIIKQRSINSIKPQTGSTFCLCVLLFADQFFFFSFQLSLLLDSLI